MEDNLLYRLWGKTNERDKGYMPEHWRYHPAVCHMIDVGYVADVWLEVSPSIMKRFCQLAPGIEPNMLRRIIVTITALHDLGKVHRNFQAKSEKGWERGYGTVPGMIRDYRGAIGFDHGLGTARLLFDLYERANGFPELMKWCDAIAAAAAHHGSFHAWEIIEEGGEHCPRLCPEEMMLVHEIVAILSEIFRLAGELPLPPKNKGFLMLLAGFVSVADWFGSNAFLFPFVEEGQVLSSDDARRYHQELKKYVVIKALRERGLLPRYTSISQDYLDLFDVMKSESDLRPLQRKSRRVHFGETTGAEIVIIEAPMGMGKTEIALYLASRAVIKNNADGVYIALPTQASSNSMMKRAFAFAEHVKESGTEISVMLAHGGRRYQQEFVPIIKTMIHAGDRGNLESNNENTPAEVVAPEWLLSSKRVLLAAIGVGTIDQAMLGALSVRHAFVRLFALAGKVVILDEIHAYDAYMNTIILRLLGWLRLLDTKIILLSATLPRSLREKLMNAYGVTVSEPKGEPENDPYPQILYTIGGQFQEPMVLKTKDQISGEYLKPDVNVIPVECNNDERTDLGAERALELAESGGCIVWIRNTVKEAQAAYEALKPKCAAVDIELEILHAQYMRADRNAKEDILLKRLGKEKPTGLPRPTKFILIATQVIEQSVDIDFDAMLSDLAPVDLLLQRAGRLWRHRRDATGERHGHTSPQLYVLLPEHKERHALSFGSSAYVYDADILARTATLLLNEENQQWEMPQACRRLVALLYDHGTEEWSDVRMKVDAGLLAVIRSRQENRRDGMESKAKKITLRGLSEKEQHLQMANYTLSDDEKGERIELTTRYGMNSVAIVLLQRNARGRLVFAGSTEVLVAQVPLKEDADVRIQVEEAVALSTVSFPWYGGKGNELLQESIALEAKEMLAWWREHHPYDTKVFAVIEEGKEGEKQIRHSQFIATYERQDSGSAERGLVITERIKRADGEIRASEVA